LSKLHREDAALRAEIHLVLDEVDNAATAHRFGSVREMTLAAPNVAPEAVNLPPGMPQLALRRAGYRLGSGGHRRRGPVRGSPG
jgi:hypothetical protein